MTNLVSDYNNRHICPKCDHQTLLYVKEWVGLTDEEIKEILDCGRPDLINIKKAEQKLKEKNT
jgi:hypothetical protein